MAATLTFFKFDRVIQVDAPQVEVTIQDLINQIRNYEDEVDFLPEPKIADAYGKQPLGGGSYVGITLVLVNDWRVAFEARSGPDTVTCTVSGGNLVASNSYNNNPIKPTAYTQVVISQSSSPTIITPADNTNLKYLIASLEGTQKTVGDFIYWDPTNGSDTNDGTTPSSAVATFSAAQSKATPGNYDVIYCLANNSSGETTITTPIEITVNTLKVRGPGHIFKIIPSTAGNDTITISADNVEVSGLFVGTADSGTDNAISITGNRALIKDCWISNVQGHGIDISGSQRTKITSSAIEHCGSSGTGNGINIRNNTTQTAISKCIIYNNTNGISLSGTGVADNVIENSLIYQNSAYGIAIASGVNRTIGRNGNTMANNTSGNIQNLGTDSYFEASAGGATPTEIADAVWDEIIATHTATGSAGKTLKDAKTKATLASLK